LTDHALTAPEPERRRNRRLGAWLVLGVGIALAATQLGPAVPRDQTIVFRLPPAEGRGTTRLDASFTKVGERESHAGVSLTLEAPRPARVRHRLRLPNGDYIVALQLTSGATTGPSAPEKTETSRARRVTLSGDETLIVFEAEGSD